MSVSYRQVDAALAAFNPAPTVEPGLDPRARMDLSEILASDPGAQVEPGVGAAPHRAVMPRRRVALRYGVPVAAAVASVLAVTMTPLGDLGGSHSSDQVYAMGATPLAYIPLKDSDPADVLEPIAVRAAAAADDTGTGKYARLRTRGWYLNVSVDGDKVTPTRSTEERTSWIAADGSGRILSKSTETGTPAREDDDLAKPGEYTRQAPFPADLKALTQRLDKHNGPAAELDAIKSAYLDQPLPPAVRASMLRYLATVDDLTVDGKVTDRAGREGIGFSTTSEQSGLETRYTLIIDPDNGKLLSEEQTVLEDEDHVLRIKVPSVTSYTMFLSATFTDDLK